MSAFDRFEAGLLEHIASLDTARPAAARRRLPRAALGALTAGLAGAAVAVAAVLPSSGPTPARLLSPEAAVAAAEQRLDSDGILEWSDVQGGAGGNREREGTTITRWIDLRTGDHSEFQQQRYAGPSGDVRLMVASIWSVGRTTWLNEGQTSKTSGKPVIRKHVVDRPPVAARYRNSPLDQIQRTLQRARAGDLPFRDAGRVDGVPVVRIVDERKEFKRTLWISKERSPRLMKSRYVIPCPLKICRSAAGGPGLPPTVSESRTLTWRIHPRTTAALAKIQPPDFDPARYTVITTRRK